MFRVRSWPDEERGVRKVDRSGLSNKCKYLQQLHRYMATGRTLGSSGGTLPTGRPREQRRDPSVTRADIELSLSVACFILDCLTGTCMIMARSVILFV